MHLTVCQSRMLEDMNNATLYYRFLLCLICSTSFKNYFDMLSKPLTPGVDLRELYVDHFEKTIVSKVKKAKVEKAKVEKAKAKRPNVDAVRVAVVADAVGNAVEAEVDTVGQLEEEALFEGVSYAS